MYAVHSTVPGAPSPGGLVETEAQPSLKPYSDVVICFHIIFSSGTKLAVTLTSEPRIPSLPPLLKK